MGEKVAILTVGSMWDMGLAVKQQLEIEMSLSAKVVGLRWIRPIDLEALVEAISTTHRFIIIEDSYLHSSAAAYILTIITARTESSAYAQLHLPGGGN